MIVPIAHSNMNISDMITEVNSDYISSSIGSDSLISIVFSQEIIDMDFDALVKIDAVTDEQTHTLDSASFADVVIADTSTIGETINEIPLGPIIFPNGSTNSIPAIQNVVNEDTVNIDASEYFETMTLYKGFLIIEFINNYPTDISNISLSIINSVNQNLIATFHFPVIASGTTVSDSVSIAGQTIDENILGILHNMDINASNGPVLINYEDAIITKITISDIGITEATAIFPEQQLTENLKEHSFEMGNAQIKEIGIKSGTVKINVLSTLPNGKMIYNIPSLKKNGVPFTSGDMIIPESTGLELTTFEFNFEGYVLDLTGEEGRVGGDTVNTIYTEAYTFIDYTGELVTINNIDSFYSYIEFDLTPEYALGYIGQDTFVLDAETRNTSIFDNIIEGTIDLEEANLNLQLENYVGSDVILQFNELNTENTHNNSPPISASSDQNGNNIIDYPYIINRAILNNGVITPSITNITLDASDMIEVFPNQITVASTIILNPNGPQNTEDFIYTDYTINASIDATVPLSFIANNLTISGTISADLSSDEEIEIDELYITLKNGFPLSAKIDIILMDEYYNVIDTLLNNTNIESANTDEFNKVTIPKQTVLTINNTNFDNVKNVKVISSFTTSSLTENVDIYSYYSMDVSLSARFKKIIGK